MPLRLNGTPPEAKRITNPVKRITRAVKRNIKPGFRNRRNKNEFNSGLQPSAGI